MWITNTKRCLFFLNCGRLWKLCWITRKFCGQTCEWRVNKKKFFFHFLNISTNRSCPRAKRAIEINNVQINIALERVNLLAANTKILLYAIANFFYYSIAFFRRAAAGCGGRRGTSRYTAQRSTKPRSSRYCCWLKCFGWEPQKIKYKYNST